MRRTSFNLNGQLTGGREAQALAFVRNYQPTTFLVMSGQPLAKQMARENPNTIVIHRQYIDSPYNEGDAHFRVTPQRYIDDITRGFTPADKCWMYVMNEPWADWPDMPKLLNWLIECMHELSRRGFRGVIGNFGPGSFQPWQVDSGVFDQYLKVLGAYSEAGKMVGGWHEYTAILAPFGVGQWPKEWLLDRNRVQPPWPTNLPIERVPQYIVDDRLTTMPRYWHILRITWFDLRAKTIGAPIHRKIITEGFWDRMPDLTLGSGHIYEQLEKRFGTSGHATIRCAKSARAVWAYYFPQWSFDRAMYEQLIWLEKIYPPSVIGWNLFTWSFGAPDWDIAYGCNYGDMDELRSLLITNRNNEPGVNPVAYKILPAANDTRWQTVISTVSGINIRSIPTTTGNTPIGQVQDGQTVKIITDTAAKEGVWLPIYANNLIGWVSGDVFKYRVPYGEPTKLLPVPFLTQLGTGANNCLPASVAMTVNYNSARYELEGGVTVDHIEADMNNAGGYAHINDAVALSSRYGIDFYSGAPLTWERIKAQIDAGNPVIPLVDRSKLKPTFYLSFMGAHFVVVIGYGPGYVVIHDPLSTVGGPGVGWKVPQADFDAAVYQSPGNSLMQGIFTKRSAVVVPPPPYPITEAELIEIRALVARLSVLVN